jgi:hypothetical protein
VRSHSQEEEGRQEEGEEEIEAVGSGFEKILRGVTIVTPLFLSGLDPAGRL